MKSGLRICIYFSGDHHSQHPAALPSQQNQQPLHQHHSHAPGSGPPSGTDHPIRQPGSRKTSESESAPSGGKNSTNSSSFYCFLCGFHSELSFSRMLYSSPPGKKAPYFPFMKKHVPKNRAETLRDDGTALVCTFCYHSVMVQWSRYNEAKSAMAYVDPNERCYNLHEYHCYVCGIKTYRKRIRALRVMVSVLLLYWTFVPI